MATELCSRMRLLGPARHGSTPSDRSLITRSSKEISVRTSRVRVHTKWAAENDRVQGSDRTCRSASAAFEFGASSRKLWRQLRRSCLWYTQRVAKDLRIIMPPKEPALAPDVLKLGFSASSCINGKEFDKALGFLNEAIKLEKKSPRIFCDRSAVYMELNRPEDALKDAKVAVKVRNGLPTLALLRYRMCCVLIAHTVRP